MNKIPSEEEFVKRHTIFMDYSPSDVDSAVIQNRNFVKQ